MPAGVVVLMVAGGFVQGTRNGNAIAIAEKIGYYRNWKIHASNSFFMLCFDESILLP